MAATAESGGKGRTRRATAPRCGLPIARPGPLWFALVAAVVAGCSSAPASPNLSTGATAIEKQGRFDCQITRHRMTQLTRSMAGLPAVAKSQVDAPPSTLVAAWQRMTGPTGSGLAAVNQFEVEKARYERLQAAAAENACSTSDIQPEFDKAVAAMAELRARK